MRNIVNQSVMVGVVWLGKAQEDEYYRYCNGQFEIIEFDDPYEMTVELLKGLETPVVVINSSAFCDAYNEIIVPLMKSGIVNNICVYSHMPVVSSVKFNGKVSGVKFASCCSELADMLKEVLLQFSKPTQIINEAEREKDIKDGNEVKEDRGVKEESEPKEKREIKKENKLSDKSDSQYSVSDGKSFVPAELTADELQALLGPDYKLEIDIDDNHNKNSKDDNKKSDNKKRGGKE